jgi:hypothetical protein
MNLLSDITIVVLPNSLEFGFIFDTEVIEAFYTRLTTGSETEVPNDVSSSVLDEPKPDTQPSFHPETPASKDPIIQQESQVPKYIFNSLSRTDILFLTSVFVYYILVGVVVYVYPDLFFLKDIAPLNEPVQGQVPLDEQARLIKFGREVRKPVQR